MRRTRRVTLDPEQKFMDRFASFDALQAGDGFLLNAVAQGVGQGQRIGNQQITTSCFTTITVQVPASAAPVLVRIALVVFKQPQGVALDLDDYWDQLATQFAGQSNRNVTQAPQFKTLWKRNVTVNLAFQNRTIRINKRMRLLSRYSTAGGGIPDLQTGALYLLFSTGAAGLDAPAVTMNNRIRFVG